MNLRLFHFSDDGSIECFHPRPVRVSSPRAKGQEWLNGALVWAIDEWHQPMYLFPRECPRILLWRTDRTTEEDAEKHFGSSGARIVAYVETGWVSRLESESLYRYELPTTSFRSLGDAGMWVSSNSVQPIEMVPINDLRARLTEAAVDLRVLDVLTSLRDVWSSTLHASGIRLRNAREWTPNAPA